MQDSQPPEPEEAVFERHLATIMMADVVGYSRMMGESEERTVRMLRGHREVFDALLKAHRGRIFNTAGDAILAEFPSAVEAVRCATEIQSALRTRNEHFPEDQRMWFRIGINLGDVISQGTDLLGDGVNVAARIQTVAEPGGVCISGSVYDQIQNKLTLQFKMMGERSFKNIAQPIRTFSISESESGSMPTSVSLPPPKKSSRATLIIALAGGLFLLAAAGAGYWLYQGGEQNRQVEETRQAVVLEQEAARELRQALELERQAAEAQRRLIEEEAALAAREREMAEEAQRQAREVQLAAEAARRQARLEAEAEFAKAALERAELEKQRLDQELKQVAAEKKTAEAQRVALEAQAAQAAQATKATQEKAAAAVSPFDGIYEGSLCNEATADRDRICWSVLLKVMKGELAATWPTRSGKPGVVKGTITPEGAVAMVLDGWKPDGQAISASLNGKAEQNMIKASGKWEMGLPVSGEWKKGD